MLKNEGPYADLIKDFTKEVQEKEKKEKKEKQMDTKVEGKEVEKDASDGKHTKLDDMGFGRISLKTFTTYLRYAGWAGVVLTLLIWFGGRFFGTGAWFWLSYWINTPDAAARQNSFYYLSIYALLSIFQLLVGPMALFTTDYVVALPAARRIYEKMIRNVLGAPLVWFSVTPMGQISNRLTSDISQLDSSISGPLCELFF